MATNYNLSLTIGSTPGSVSQNVDTGDTLTVTVSSGAGGTGPCVVTNNSTSVCSISSSSVSIGSSFVITANAAGTINVYVEKDYGFGFIESGTVGGTVSSSSSSGTEPDAFDLGGTEGTYGFEVYNSSGNLVLRVDDSVGFFILQYNYLTSSGSATFTQDFTSSDNPAFAKVVTTDIALIQRAYDIYWSYQVTIPSNGTVRLTGTKTESGSTVRNIYAPILVVRVP